MGKWIEEADRKTSCSKCKARIKVGQRFWFARRGTYMCELCGSLAEHDEPQIGDHEAGVLEDLRQLPPEAADRTIASLMLSTARRLDQDDVADRDYPAMVKELRTLLVQLRDLYPAEPEDDDTERRRKARERMLLRDDFNG